MGTSTTPTSATEKEKELYAIYVPDEVTPQRHMCKDLGEVKKFLDSPVGKRSGTRFKKCVDAAEIEDFYSSSLSDEKRATDSPSNSPKVVEPVSPFASLPTARFSEFRTAIESKDMEKFEKLLVENPRFLINTNTDSPTVIQMGGFRFNPMHIACRSSNYEVVKVTLDLIGDLDWLTHIYGTATCVVERSLQLFDAMLNTPDLIENNTPLHYACKFGSPELVDLLLSYEVCKRHPINKYSERPVDMLCRNYKEVEGGPTKAEVEKKINHLFELDTLTFSIKLD